MFLIQPRSLLRHFVSPIARRTASLLLGIPLALTRSQVSDADMEAVMARLKIAEQEAAALKAELASKQSGTAGKSVDELARLKPAPLASGLRVDGATSRLGGGGKADGGAWLKEARKPPKRNTETYFFILKRSNEAAQGI